MSPVIHAREKTIERCSQPLDQRVADNNLRRENTSCSRAADTEYYVYIHVTPSTQNTVELCLTARHRKLVGNNNTLIHR